MQILSERDLAMLEAGAFSGEPTHRADVQKLINNLRADRAELEWERTQNLRLTAIDEAACALIGLLRHALPDGVEAKGIDFAPYRRYRAARAALSTQEAGDD